jgi:fatty aldehyde decarbonylase
MSIATDPFPIAPPSAEEYRAVFADILSQAITGELVGMANYAAMVRLYPDASEQRGAVRHAASELRHSEAFARAARDLGVTPIVNLEAPYWQRLRSVFLRYVDSGDATACLLIQEVMLESFAVSLYHCVAEVAQGALAAVFRGIGDEEQDHVERAIEELQGALAADRDGFENKLEALHDEVMATLAELLAAEDSVAHCGLCRGDCVKGSLHQVGLDRATLRGRALNHYLRTLDRIGVRGERSLAWVARLPL